MTQKYGGWVRKVDRGVERLSGGASVDRFSQTLKAGELDRISVLCKALDRNGLALQMTSGKATPFLSSLLPR